MNHEEAVLFHATLTNSLPLTGVRTSLSPRPFPIDEEYYTAKLIFLTLRSRWHDEEKKKRTKKRRNHQQLYVPISISESRRRANKKEERHGEKKRSRALKSSSNCFAFFFFFFVSWNVTDYHETRKLNFFFFFFHLSNNWFDISEHFKGSLARRRRSKLQYKAEDLPLAECQVYARALASPSPSIFLPPPPLSLSLYLLSPNPLKY